MRRFWRADALQNRQIKRIEIWQVYGILCSSLTALPYNNTESRICQGFILLFYFKEFFKYMLSSSVSLQKNLRKIRKTIFFSSASWYNKDVPHRPCAAYLISRAERSLLCFISAVICPPLPVFWRWDGRHFPYMQIHFSFSPGIPAAAVPRPWTRTTPRPWWHFATKTGSVPFWRTPLIL